MSAVSPSPLHSSSSFNNVAGTASRNSHRKRAGHSPMSPASVVDEANLVRLCINKPNAWNWELTTSKSSPSIAFPLIQLYDKSSGELLAQTNEADCQIRGEGSKRGSRGPSATSNSIIHRSSASRRNRRANIPEIIRESRDDAAATACDVHGEWLSPSSGQRQLPLKISHSRSRSWQNEEISRDNKQQAPSRERATRSCSRKLGGSQSQLDEVLHGIADQYAREGVNCKFTFHNQSRRPSNSEEQQHQANYALGRSKSTTYVPITKAASNSSCVSTPGGGGAGTRTKKRKKYRRAQSVNSLRFSNSILERIREYKRCTSCSSSTTSPSPSPTNTPAQVSPCPSDPEDNVEGGSSSHLSPCGTIKRKIRMVHSATDIPAEEANRPTEEDVHRPKYTLRTSKAGTLVVCEESFRHRKVRRRPRSLTRSETTDKEPPAIFSPERVKTTFEYIGTAHGESGSDAGSRYQREIDNIDRILEKLKEEQTLEGVDNAKSTASTRRRHKSLADRHQSPQQTKSGSEGVGAHSEAERRAAIRFLSHQRGIENESVDDERQDVLLLPLPPEKRPTRTSSEKRISFGRTTFKTKSTEDEENVLGGGGGVPMEINCLDNNRRPKTDGDDRVDKAERWRRPEVSVSGSGGIVASGHGECSDKDKSGANRRHVVRRTRRSWSAESSRRTEAAATSSTDSNASGAEDQQDDGETPANRRGRSRTRRRRPQHQDEGSSHKLMVQGELFPTDLRTWTRRTLIYSLRESPRVSQSPTPSAVWRSSPLNQIDLAKFLLKSWIDCFVSPPSQSLSAGLTQSLDE